MTTLATPLRLVAFAALGLSVAAPASADQLPQRKPGLWESTSYTAEGEIKARQCVGAGSDQAAVVAVAGKACSKNVVTKTAQGWSVETKCEIGQITAEGSGVVTGDFESALRTETTTRTTAPGLAEPVERKTVIEAKRLGECEPGQKPGDVILPDGKVISIPSPK